MAGLSTDYTVLSLADVRAGLDDVARDAQATFGGFDRRQLNWRPDETQWSIGQCFEHLLTANRLMLQAADDALNRARPRTLWQRLPVLPGLLGRTLIRSQAPETMRKFTAAPKARPAADVAEDVIGRFVEQHREAAARVAALDERRAARTIMTSPFISVVTYSVLDGWRLIVAHDRRHVAQARRVALSPGFPTS
jgi:hypothetical protein